MTSCSNISMIKVACRVSFLCCFMFTTQAAGACWYLLGIQRAAKCLREQCGTANGCTPMILSCKEPIYYGASSMVTERSRLAWGENHSARSLCINIINDYDYGAYKWTVQLVTNDSRLEKILFPIFWGLMTLRLELEWIISMIYELTCHFRDQSIHYRNIKCSSFRHVLSDN